MSPEVAKIYGNKLRVRVCGICWEKDRLLMVNHKGITGSDFWSLPGGGLDFGQSIAETLAKEFEEETGLLIDLREFLFGCEFIQEPLHAIELFFNVALVGGQLKTGNDPELPIITDVRFMTPEEIAKIPKDQLHGIFRIIDHPASLKSLNGFFRI